MLSTIFIFSSIPAFTYAEINNDILENSLSSNKVITSTENGSKDEITESNEESNLSLMKSSYLYEINYEQTKINYKKVSVEIPNLKRILDLNKADSVVIKGSMNYNGNTVQNFSKKVSLSNIKDNSFTIDFPTYGKFSVQAIFYKDNKIVNTNSSSIVGVVADEYNLAALNATFPVVQFTLSLWDMKENTALRKRILAALFLAIGLILPFITMQIPTVGKMLCPMHIPVLLCGYICGWPYGLLIGIITPLLRGVLFGMPAIFPNAFCMAFELATYGLVAGILSEKMKKDIKSLYISLIAAMLCGRIVWGLVSAAVYAFTGGIFTWELFLMGGFINALPGILIQLVLIPALVERLYNMEGTVEWN